MMTEEGSGTLPTVLVKGRDLGGADAVKRMHETGKLARVFKPCDGGSRDEGETGEERGVCGDVRFVLRVHCSGSRRV